MEILLDNYLKLVSITKIAYLIGLISTLYLYNQDIIDKLDNGSKFASDLYYVLLFFPLFGTTNIRSGNKLQLFINLLIIFSRILQRYEEVKDDDEDDKDQKLDLIKLLLELLLNTYILLNVIPGTNDVQVPTNMQIVCFLLASGNLGFTVKDILDQYQ